MLSTTTSFRLILLSIFSGQGQAIFDQKVDHELRNVCMEIEKRYEVKFLEIGVDKDHVHFLIQSVPTYSVTSLVKMIKSLTAREIFIAIFINVRSPLDCQSLVP